MLPVGAAVCACFIDIANAIVFDLLPALSIERAAVHSGRPVAHQILH